MPKKKKLTCHIDSNDLYVPNEQNFITKNYQEIYIHINRLNYSVNSIHHNKIENHPYSSEYFINDVKNELIHHSECLSVLFKKRSNKYSNSMLSKLWKNNENYIKYKYAYIKKYPNYIIKSEDIQVLKNILSQKFNKRASKCLEIIHKYQNLVISMTIFFQMLTNEVGRISGEIPVSNKELSILFGYNERYLTDNFNMERDKFTLEALNTLEKNLKFVFQEIAQKCIMFIKKYKNANKNLKLYSFQQYTISNPSYFSELNKVEKFYWLGFLFADGSLDEKEHRIKFKLKKDDGERVDLFASQVGLKKERVRDVNEFIKYKNGKIKNYIQRVAQFGCRPMAEDLKKIDFLKFKKGEIGLPKFVISLIKKARNISNDLLKSVEGNFALSFLLGFYDGDGSYEGGKSAYIGNTNRQFLIDIQNWYNSPNQIRLRVKGDGKIKNTWALTLGPNLFLSIFQSFGNSMKRKKPKEI